MILAARALGLDCGPMSGFDNARLHEEFFVAGNDSHYRNFLLMSLLPTFESGIAS
jgi:nitroreductase